MTISTDNPPIAVLIEAGLEEIEAAIALERIERQLVSPSDDGRRRLAELGFGLEEVDPGERTLPQIVRRFAVAELAEEDAWTIFGRRAAPAILALIERIDRLEELQSTPRID